MAGLFIAKLPFTNLVRPPLYSQRAEKENKMTN